MRDPIATKARLAADRISNVHLLVADITDVAALKQAVEEAKRILGGRGLDVLVNNAAYVSKVTSIKSFQDLYGSTVLCFRILPFTDNSLHTASTTLNFC